MTRYVERHAKVSTILNVDGAGGITGKEVMAVDPHVDPRETIAAMHAVLDALHDSLRTVGTCIAISREQIASSRALLAAVTTAALPTPRAAMMTP